MRFKILRSDRGGANPRYESFEIRLTPGMSVLEALFAIQDEHDDSLAFRYSCRGAVCGSCAMSINREPRLACRTQVADISNARSLGLTQFKGLTREKPWDKNMEVLIEPLPNLPVERDLIVDMTRFFVAYKKIRPWLDEDEDRKSLSTMMPEEVSKVEKYANCILCAACFGACPVCEKDSAYVGPAALAWSYRFFDDVRETKRSEKLRIAGEKDGVPGCEFIYNCVKVCPKNVAPALAIRNLKNQLDSKI